MQDKIVKQLNGDQVQFEAALVTLQTAGTDLWDEILGGVTWEPSKYAMRGEAGELVFDRPLKPHGASAERTRMRILKLLHLAPGDAAAVHRVRNRATSLLVRSMQHPVDLGWLSNWPSLRHFEVRGEALVHGAAPTITTLHVETLRADESTMAAMGHSRSSPCRTSIPTCRSPTQPLPFASFASWRTSARR